MASQTILEIDLRFAWLKESLPKLIATIAQIDYGSVLPLNLIEPHASSAMSAEYLSTLTLAYSTIGSEAHKINSSAPRRPSVVDIYRLTHAR